MSTSGPTLRETVTGADDGFSLVLGGPFFQLWRRAHLSGSTLDLVRRRVVVLVVLAWVPLLVLSLLEGHFADGSAQLPFLNDVEMHARLLLALPLLIVAELIVHRRLRPLVQQFLDRGLVPDSARPRFDASIASAARWRDSMGMELLLIAFVYVIGVGVIWRAELALDVSSWYGVTVDGRLQPSLAGWWLGLVSLPLFQFLLLRWYWRLIIWTRFLWQVSRIPLSLVPTHPDRSAGLGFLAEVTHAFAPLLLAEGVLLAGVTANRIFFAGARLVDFKPEIGGLAVVMVLAILGPLLVFSPQLAAARRVGLLEYGSMAQRYVRDFDQKWLRGGAPPDEPFIGTADIQSLADLDNGFDVVKSMRVVPFGVRTVAQLTATALAPVAPLVLTMFSLQEVVQRLLKIVL